MNKVKISVVIPACDRKDLIIETLNSVYSQTSLPDEIIIVNNGVEEITLKETSNIKTKVYKTIKYLGVAQALNFGVSVADGDYIAFLEDDDLWGKNYILNLRESFDNYCSAYVSRIDKLENNKITKYKNAYNKISIKNLLSFNPGINISNLCILKEAIFSVKGFDPNLKVGADRSMVIDLLIANHKFKVLENNQEISRFHEGYRLSRDYKSLISSHIKFYSKYRKIMNTKHKLKLIYKVLFLLIFKKI